VSQLPNRPIIQKTHYVRSKAAMVAARSNPCGNCGAEDGTIVGAHANWPWANKGGSIKADDVVASLCFRCHAWLDQGFGPDPTGVYDSAGDGKETMWLRAFHATIVNGVRCGTVIFKA